MLSISPLTTIRSNPATPKPVSRADEAGDDHDLRGLLDDSSHVLAVEAHRRPLAFWCG